VHLLVVTEGALRHMEGKELSRLRKNRLRSGEIIAH